MGSTGRKSFLPENQLNGKVEEAVTVVVAQFLLSVVKNRRQRSRWPRNVNLFESKTKSALRVPPMNPAIPIDLQTGSQRLLRADEPPCYGLSVGGHDFPDGRAVALPRDTVDAVTGCNLVARQGYRLRSN